MKVQGAAIWIWWCMMMMTIITTIQAEEEVIKVGLTFKTITFDLNNERGYEQFLNTLRNSLANSTRPCNIASTKSTPTRGEEYVYVKLRHSATVALTLGIDAKDLYIWGYQDRINDGRTARANFFQDIPAAARDVLFPGSTRRILRFGSSYGNLERAASDDVTRLTVPLTFTGLRSDVTSLYGKAVPVGQDEAKFFLRAVQMIVEAARFRFLQKAIRDGKADNHNFRLKVEAYETSWDNISQGLHKSAVARGSNKCQVFSPPVTISGSGYRAEVSRVNEIREEIGLVKHVTQPRSSLSYQEEEEEEEEEVAVM